MVGGEFCVFGKLGVKVVFELFQCKRKEVIFVLEVCVERGAVDHCFVAKVDDADFLNRLFFHHIKKRVGKKFSRTNNSQIFFCRHFCVPLNVLSYVLLHKYLFLSRYLTFVPIQDNLFEYFCNRAFTKQLPICRRVLQKQRWFFGI